jgi:hypothetical protein
MTNAARDHIAKDASGSSRMHNHVAALEVQLAATGLEAARQATTGRRRSQLESPQDVAAAARHSRRWGRRGGSAGRGGSSSSRRHAEPEPESNAIPEPDRDRRDCRGRAHERAAVIRRPDRRRAVQRRVYDTRCGRYHSGAQAALRCNPLMSAPAGGFGTSHRGSLPHRGRILGEPALAA